MRILFVHTKYLQSAGGEDATLEAETKLLRANGHDIEILFFDNANMGTGFKGKINAGLSAIYNRRSARILGDAINQFRPDVIHVHNFFFTASPSIFFKATREKIPIIATIHNFRLICANALLLRNNKVCELCIHHTFPWYGVKYKCYHDSALQSALVGSTAAVHKLIGTWKKKVNLFITPASFTRNKLIHSSFNAPQEKIVIKHNFIEDPGFSAAASRKPFFLFVGRLSAEKGVDILLRAAARAPEIHLVVVGDGPEKERLLLNYGHLENVEFTGKKTHDEVLALMKQCLALIFPSICYEGLPLTIIEAMATGTPVIASRMGAMQEMIVDRQNGLLFEPAADEHLAKLMSEFILKNETERSPLHTNARKTYLNEYHPDKCYTEIMKIYNNVISVGRDH